MPTRTQRARQVPTFLVAAPAWWLLAALLKTKGKTSLIDQAVDESVRLIKAPFKCWVMGFFDLKCGQLYIWMN
jgi:hypothetical protein